MKQKKRGFTLVELVIVIAVIAILAGVMIAVFANVVKDAKESAKLQEAKQAELQQKMEDITAKLENADWLGWEDFENELAAQLAASDAKNEQIIADAIKQHMQSTASGNTGLTEEQMADILDRALSGQLTEAQVEIIVRKYSNNSLTEAQVSKIVNAAMANQLTAAQVKDIVDGAQSNLEAKIQEVVSNANSNADKINERIDSLEALLNKYISGSTTELKPSEGAGAVTFDELNAAIANAANGSTIKISGALVMNEGERIDIPEGKTLTLDLSGATVNKTNTVGYIIDNYGFLTIKGDGNTVINLPTRGIQNYGTLVVDQVKFTADQDVHQGSVIYTYPDSTTTVTNCEITTGHCAVSNNGGNLTLTNCKIASSSSNEFAPYWSYAVVSQFSDESDSLPYAVINETEVKGIQGAVAISGGYGVINGGHYETEIGNSRSFYALYVAGESGLAGATVNGGTFVGGYRSAVWVANNTPGDGGLRENASCVIRGGTFLAPTGANVVNVNEEIGDLSVQGGTYLNYTGGDVSDTKPAVSISHVANGYEFNTTTGTVSKN